MSQGKQQCGDTVPAKPAYDIARMETHGTNQQLQMPSLDPCQRKLQLYESILTLVHTHAQVSHALLRLVNRRALPRE